MILDRRDPPEEILDRALCFAEGEYAIEEYEADAAREWLTAQLASLTAAEEKVTQLERIRLKNAGRISILGRKVKTVEAERETTLAAAQATIARLSERLTIYKQIEELLCESGGPHTFGSLILSAASEHAEGWEEHPHMARSVALVRGNIEEILSFINDLDRLDAEEGNE